MSEIAVSEAEKPQRPGWSKAEIDFYDELSTLGVNIEGFIYRPPVSWIPRMYGYRLTLPNGWRKTGFIPWDEKTFETVLSDARS